MQRFHCDAILFDLDGVLVDSTACVERLWYQWAIRHGLDAQEVIACAHGRRTVDTMRAVAPTLAIEEEARRMEQAEIEDTQGLVSITGAADLLTSLAPSQWAVVTSGSRALATTRLRAVGLPLPLIFITAGDVAQGKPHPEGYLKAASLLGVTPQRCVVIEDAPAGIQAALKANMTAIAVASTHQPSELQAARVCVPSLAALHVIHLKGSDQARPSLTITITRTIYGQLHAI
ncbi:haloacid dehalogenase [Ktedonobacter sp. SOSP1-52]|uniref:HAD family hydrolase n=1 Tax=Ktedonobacter sp. SOSP1-52 TaxID=2778366 RepID=UPI001916B987|nr:HAD family hydrolase [Ktedonobacter sp. SOSP1-52]GHO68343.1 haloacid dehalogenase [Ktedonobacter sp. SOSP1-52]